MITVNNTILKITAGKIADGFKAEITAAKKIRSIKWYVKDSVCTVRCEP